MANLDNLNSLQHHLENLREFNRSEREFLEYKRNVYDQLFNDLLKSEKIHQGLVKEQIKEKGILRGIVSAQEKIRESKKLQKEMGKKLIKDEQNLNDLQKKLNNELEKRTDLSDDLKKGLDERLKKERVGIEYQKLQHEAYKNSLTSGQKLLGVVGTIASGLGKGLLFIFDIGKFLLKGILAPLKKAWEMWLEMEKSVRNLSVDLGMSESLTKQLTYNIQDMFLASLDFGGSLEDALIFTNKFSDITGRNRVILGDQVKLLMGIAKSTGLGAENVAEMYANFNVLNFSVKGFTDYMSKVRVDSARLGLNVTKVLKTIGELLPAFKALNFKEGLNGLSELVQKAQILRFDLSNMRNLANKVFEPEGAIEIAAQLKLMGGEFGKLADPMKLMFQGQSAAADLMIDVMNAASSFAVKNKDGIFTIPPKQQAIIRQIATILEESPDNLITASLEGAKLSDKLLSLGKTNFLAKEDRIAIANLAEYSKEDGGYLVTVDHKNTKKLLNELTDSEAYSLINRIKSEQDAAKSRLNFMENLKLMGQKLLVSLTPIFDILTTLFTDTGLMDEIQNTVTSLSSYLIDTLVPLFKSEESPIYKFLKKFGNSLTLIFEEYNEFIKDKSGFKEIVGGLFTKVITPFIPLASDFFAKVMLEALNIMFPGRAKRRERRSERYNIMSSPDMNWFQEFGALWKKGDFWGAINNQIGQKVWELSTLGLTGNPIYDADDFIIQNNKVVKFNKDDLIIGGTGLMGKGKPLTSDYNTSNYGERENFVHHSPMNINININGTLEVKSGDTKIQLDANDLKELVTKELAAAIEYEMIKTSKFGSQKETSGFLKRPM